MKNSAYHFFAELGAIGNWAWGYDDYGLGVGAMLAGLSGRRMNTFTINGGNNYNQSQEYNFTQINNLKKDWNKPFLVDVKPGVYASPGVAATM